MCGWLIYETTTSKFNIYIHIDNEMKHQLEILVLIRNWCDFYNNKIVHRIISLTKNVRWWFD